MVVTARMRKHWGTDIARSSVYYKHNFLIYLSIDPVITCTNIVSLLYIYMSSTIRMFSFQNRP